MIEKQRIFAVVVVGQGPVGQLIASLLASRGHQVVILEKHAQPYRLPRAVHLTGEALRTVDAIGAADGYSRFGVESTHGIEFRDANHDVLLRLDMPPGSSQGWPLDLSLSQPDFEDVLRERAANLPNLTAITGTEVVGVRRGADHVTVEYQDRAGNRRSVSGRYLIGCDGAGSFIRQTCGFTVTDTGFSADWFVVDIRCDVQRQWTAAVTQVCDPLRPTTCVESGPGRRRFEFMRTGDEAVSDLSSAENAWSLITPWGYTPENAVMEKKEVYTFRARWADRWLIDRVILAGDAAHQMPPMGGVGLVSGIRDAANLVWKLDLVLAGRADPWLLETYGSERSEHVQHAIWTSVEYGRLVCETDVIAAEARDRRLRALGPAALPIIPPERLGAGAFPPKGLADSDWVGTLGPQGRVRLSGGTEDLTDRLNPGAFTLLLDGSRIDVETAEELARALPPGIRAGVFLIVDADGGHEPAQVAGITVAADIEGVYRRRFDETGALLEIQRPDFYVYGLASDADQALRLVGSLAAALHLNTVTRNGHGIDAVSVHSEAR